MKKLTLHDLAQRHQTIPPDESCLEAIQFFMRLSDGFCIDHVLTPDNYGSELERLKAEYPVVRHLHEKPSSTRLKGIWVSNRHTH